MGNYYLYKTAYFITRNLPLSVSYAIAIFLADCQYFLSKTDRQAVAENLKVILKTDKVPSSMVRHVFHDFGKYLVDFFTMTKRVNKEFIKNSVEILGIEYINEILNKGKGAIILSAHIGNWEVAGAVMSSLDYPLSIVALAHKDRQVNNFFNEQREFFGTTVIPTNVALRSCVSHLKRNRLIAILGDRDFGHHGLKMDFFGKKAIIPTGAAFFSIKTGAPIVLAFFLRTPKDGFHIEFSKPIYPATIKEGQNAQEEIENLIKKYLPLMEEQIRTNANQWLVFRRFETV